MMTDLLALCHVPRWSIVPHSRAQSVAEHSFRVFVIALELRNRLNYDADLIPNIMYWALIHDGPESRTGDIPASYKRDDDDYDSACPWYRFWHGSMDARVKYIVKLADRIEACTYIRRWGVGKHAEHVADAIYAQLLAIDDLRIRTTVMALVGDIMDDRDRPYESYREVVSTAASEDKP